MIAPVIGARPSGRGHHGAAAMIAAAIRARPR
jgi:hypothetical protein